METSTYVETQSEYQRSNDDLRAFLKRPSVKEVLSPKCVNAIRKLQDNLETKEYKLAGYHRHSIKDCMDACTTSPVEANNNTVKHGPMRINSRFDIDRSVFKLMSGVNIRLRNRRNSALRQLGLTNKASCAPSKDYTTRRGQALIDRNHDRSRYVKRAQLGQEEWLAWQFFHLDSEDVDFEDAFLLPRFYRVRRQKLREIEDGKMFLHCDCDGRTREGVPCECFFGISRDANIPDRSQIDMAMIDVRHTKVFHAKYGDPGQVGTDIYDAQTQCFKYEGMGTRIPTEFAEEIVGDADADYPILGKNTSEEELEEALWVLDR